MGSSVGAIVDSASLNRFPDGASLEVRMLGRLTIRRHGVALTLPRSRKLRALFGYLSLAPRPVPRSQLCELLWDVPNDPRGELRWCLSKIRGLVDEPGRRRVDTEADTVSLDLADSFVDVAEIDRAAQEGFDTIASSRLRALAASFAGDFLEGVEIHRSSAFEGWLTAQRRRFRGCHVAMLEQLFRSASDDNALPYLEAWLQLAPLDGRVHQLMLNALARRGRLRDGDEHVAATVRLFAAEELDSTSLRDAWQSAKTRSNRSPVADAAATTRPATVEANAVATVPRRASIAVTPFVEGSAALGARGGIGDALVHDVITRLAKLRSLFVIAQGTIFALHQQRIGAAEAGRVLTVDYLVSGSVRRHGKRLAVMVELVEMRSARIIWADTFDRKLDEAFLVLDEIGDRIVASVAHEVETLECNRAVLRPPSSLDAWEAHHCGLWHMYRFNKHDNEQARHFFEKAVRLDPTFARAHAGLSFTHFQNAFQGWAERDRDMDRAYEAAGQSLVADDRDPAAHWAMGRALWLRGRHDQAVTELEQAVDLSPNFAIGHYTLAFVHSQSGDPNAAISSSDHSRHLSPFDPMLFGMLGARAMALVRLGRFVEAADWGVKAAARPNAHSHILAIAAYSLALAGRLDEARAYLATIRTTRPLYGCHDFLSAMRFSPEGERLFREGARLTIGTPSAP